MLERTDDITNEVLEPITFVLAYLTVSLLSICDLVSAAKTIVRFSEITGRRCFQRFLRMLSFRAYRCCVTFVIYLN